MRENDIPIRVFYYWSQRDEELGRQLNCQLGVLENQGEISTWHNDKLLGGDVTNEVLLNKIDTADIILLLISSSFLNSESWQLTERVLRDRLTQRNIIIRVVPIILRPCSWEIIDFIKQFRPLPCCQGSEAVPINQWQNRDEAFAQISQEIRVLSESIRQERIQLKQHNIRVYENALYGALKRERPLRPATKVKLGRLQKILGLEDKDIQLSEDLVNARVTDDSTHEEEYRSEVKANIQEDRGEISPISRVFLDQKRELLGISPQVAKAIESEELKHPQTYERLFSAVYRIEYFLGDSAKHRLMMVARKLGLEQTGFFRDIQNRILERIRISREDADFIINSKIIPQDLLEPKVCEGKESEVGIDYSRLRLALEAHNWEAADQETYQIFVDFLKKPRWERRIAPEKLLDFPSLDLKTIDNLWKTYSQGHFWFSTQIQIFQGCGGLLNGRSKTNLWRKFGRKLGWANENHWLYYFELSFDLTAPKGHLPGKIFSIVDGPLLLQIAHIANLEFAN
jgi:hypothetical protein